MDMDLNSKGGQMMLKAVIKALGLDEQKVTAMVDHFSGMATEIKTSFERIEANQIRILAMLESKQTELPNGNGNSHPGFTG